MLAPCVVQRFQLRYQNTERSISRCVRLAGIARKSASNAMGQERLGINARIVTVAVTVVACAVTNTTAASVTVPAITRANNHASGAMDEN